MIYITKLSFLPTNRAVVEQLLDVYSKVEDVKLVRALRNFPTEADFQSVPVADSDERRLAVIQNGLTMMDI
jgi:hypothetical protein